MTAYCVRRESAFRKKPRHSGSWEDAASTKSAIISTFWVGFAGQKGALDHVIEKPGRKS